MKKELCSWFRTKEMHETEKKELEKLPWKKRRRIYKEERAQWHAFLHRATLGNWKDEDDSAER